MPRRYLAVVFTFIGLVIVAGLVLARGLSPWWLVPLAALAGVGAHDLLQARHAVLRNYPIWGHLRFFFEFIRPEIRQYFVEDDNEQTPFSRQQRSIVYQRAKVENESRPFGTELDVMAAGYEWIGHSISPTALPSHDFRRTVGEARAKPYDISVFNISAMSFGALSANAIQALNTGAARGRFAHDTGEGSISPYHRAGGGDLIWELGSGYFGCRHEDGSFNAERFAEQAASEQVKLVEIKLSQGAKPGHGGVLPGAKVSFEIAQTRGVAQGVACVSPASHSEFSTPIGLLQFVERLRGLSGGKPTGFKLCIGHPWEFFAIAKAMLETGITPDFIVVDGGEGGTGAAPMEFSDHVGTPLQEGLLLVHNTLVGTGLRDRIRIGASGKVITAFDIARNMALGADWCNAARGFMFALGCIQSQKCHTDRCPTGVATQDKGRQRALVVPDKAERVYRFHENTLHALRELVEAAGLQHPSDLRPQHIVRRVSSSEVRRLSELLSFLEPGELLGDMSGRSDVFGRYWLQARPDRFQLG
jgi:glutamate synthase domain-containing protein 2